jgi:hypothetical protein
MIKVIFGDREGYLGHLEIPEPPDYDPDEDDYDDWPEEEYE